MSTTAGLGSGDYVAINGAAIASILLGVASAIVLFDSYLLLALPVAGLICGVLAIVQISQSNGTQTGRAVAAIGLLLALGFGGFFLGKKAYDSVHHQSDEHQIVSLIHQFGNSVRTKDFQSAYTLLDDRLKSRVTRQAFDAMLSHVAGNPVLGPLEKMDWNNMLSFETDAVTEQKVATGFVLLKYNSPEPMRIGMSFHNVDGKWMIDQIPSFFPEDAPNGKKQPPAQSSQPPAYGPLGPAKPQ